MSSTNGQSPIVVGVEHADQAARRRLPLRLVHAMDWPPGAERHPDPNNHGQLWSNRFESIGRWALNDARETVMARHRNLDVSAELVEGSPVKVLHQEAERASMIVLGSHKLSAAVELMSSGGVAVPLIAQAPCPVAIIREAAHHSDGEPPRIVVGIDGSHTAEQAVAYAFEAASLRGATLLAVSAEHLRPAMSMQVGRAGREKDAELRLSGTMAGWAEKFPDVRVEQMTATGHPVKILTTLSKNADCVVVGARGVGGFRGMLLGSVSQGVLHHAHCPVVVVPQDRGDAGADEG
jgi:nucleotide-binding universal stress UspA family protein